MEQQYFEICIGDGPKESYNRTFGCVIRGIRAPSIQEAEHVSRRRHRQIWRPCLGVSPIDQRTAEGCYDFSYVEQWPVFGLPGRKTAITE